MLASLISWPFIYIYPHPSVAHTLLVRVWYYRPSFSLTHVGKQCSRNERTAVREEYLHFPCTVFFLWTASAPVGTLSSAEMVHWPTSANIHCQPTPITSSVRLVLIPLVSVTCIVAQRTVLSHWESLPITDWISDRTLRSLTSGQAEIFVWLHLNAYLACLEMRSGIHSNWEYLFSRDILITIIYPRDGPHIIS